VYNTDKYLFSGSGKCLSTHYSEDMFFSYDYLRVLFLLAITEDFIFTVTSDSLASLKPLTDLPSLLPLAIGIRCRH
jgi:hypothetical protein